MRTRTKTIIELSDTITELAALLHAAQRAAREEKEDAQEKTLRLLREHDASLAHARKTIAKAEKERDEARSALVIARRERDAARSERDAARVRMDESKEVR